MVRTRPTLPSGHGEVLESPPFGEWAALLAANRAALAAAEFDVGGVGAGELRAMARTEAMLAARTYCDRLGIDYDAQKLERALHGPDVPVVATGHQPELYHPGVWIKDFLVERLSRETDAFGLDVVVDTDGFDAVEAVSPCLTPDVGRCRAYLAIGTSNGTFVGAPAPSAGEIREWCTAVDSNLATLRAPAIRRHFSAYCDALQAAQPHAANLAELITSSRRRFETPTQTRYAEVPVSAFGAAFSRFVTHIALDAPVFADAYNAELAEYRALHNTRSAAQPFPDLARDGARIELPFWVLTGLARETMWVEPIAGGGARVFGGSSHVVDLPSDPGRAAEILAQGVDGSTLPLVAPKAVTLTMYVRLFLCDLFVHGVGGGRYDRVTDGLVRRYFGFEAPSFAVASMTMYLPLGAHVVTEQELAQARERLHRLTHNPDAALDEVDLETAAERARALALAAEKAGLVKRIAEPGADKKALGMRIREVNSELGRMLAPLEAELAADVRHLESQLPATEIMTDRSYPFCFWSPEEVADKAW